MQQHVPANGFRTFVFLWASQALSVFGGMLTYFAIAIWLSQVLYAAPEQKPQLAWAISAITLARLLPMLLTTPFAGSMADRFDKKRIMLLADIGNGLISTTLVALIFAGMLELPLLLALLAMHAVLDTFHQSSFETSYINLVPREKLPRANGMMQTVFALAGILAPAMAAFVVAVPGLARQGLVPGAIGQALAGLSNGSALAIGIDGATFFISAAVLSFLQIPSPRRAAPTGEALARPSFLADFRIGATYITQRPHLLWLLATFAMANLLVSPVQIFVPLIIKFNLADNWGALGLSFESALATVGSVASIGGVLAGIVVSAWGGLKRNRVYGVVVPMIFAGAAQVIFGLSPWLYLTAAMGLITSAHVPIVAAHSHAIWQSQVPPELQGRVFAVRRIIAQFTAPLMTAVAGFLGGAFNPGTVVSVMGFGMLLFATFQLFNPHLLRVEQAAPAPKPTPVTV